MADDVPGAEALDRAASARRERKQSDRDTAFRELSRRIGTGTDLRPEDVFPRIWTLEEMVAEAVFIGDGAQVALFGEPRIALPFQHFVQLTAASKIKAAAGGRVVERAVARVWLEDKDRVNVVTRTFAPGQQAITRSPQNHLALNLWRPLPPVRAPRNWPEHAAQFLRHVTHLVPEPDERGLFLDWQAHIEQHPGELPHFHYLFIANTHGIGRNLLAAMLARVWPGLVALGVDLPGLLHGSFNGLMSCRLLAQVDELNETAGDRRSIYRAAERLKSLMTRAIEKIDPKYGRQFEEFNAKRWLLFSNHDSALFLDDKDRRVVVIRNPDQPQSEGYYTEMYRRCEDPRFIASVRKLLATRDIKAFNPGRMPPINQAKLDVIAAGRSDVDVAVLEFAEWWPGSVAAASDIRKYVFPGSGEDDHHGKESSAIRFAAIRAGIKPLQRRFRIARVLESIWVLKEHDRWHRASNSAIAKVVEDARAKAQKKEAREVQKSEEKSQHFARTRARRTARAKGWGVAV